MNDINEKMIKFEKLNWFIYFENGEWCADWHGYSIDQQNEFKCKNKNLYYLIEFLEKFIKSKQYKNSKTVVHDLQMEIEQ